jgi:hypothetical protein
MTNRRPRLTSCVLLTLTAIIGIAGCKKDEKSPPQRRVKVTTAKAAVADFDPTADFVLDLDAYGSERPDDYDIELAFAESFDAMDKCVAQYKARARLEPEQQLSGELQVAVKLNPKKGPPLGINLELPGRYEKATSLETCMRTAVATAPYPKYDGPPIVAEFETELDPGMEYWEE